MRCLTRHLVRHVCRLQWVAGAARRALAWRRHRRSTRDARDARCAVRIYTYYGVALPTMAGCGASLGPEVGLGSGSGTLARACSQSPNTNQVRARRRRAPPCRAARKRSGAATGAAGAPPLTPPRRPPLTPPPRPPAWRWWAVSPARLQPQEGGAQEGGAGGDRRPGSRGATRCGPPPQPEVVASIAVDSRRVYVGRMSCLLYVHPRRPDRPRATPLGISIKPYSSVAPRWRPPRSSEVH